MAATFSALFIDDEYLKTYTPLGKSIDVNEVYPFVQQAQEVYIQDLLGSPLYNDLESKLYNDIPYTDKETVLVDICSKALAYWSVYMALPHLAIKIRNIGVGSSQAENVETADLQKLKYIREEQKNLAEFWNTRARNYICANKNDFTLYDFKSDDMYPSTVQYDSDIYIEDKYLSLSKEELRFIKKYLS